MKTRPNKITDRSTRRLFSILAAVFFIFLGLGEVAQAGLPPNQFWDGPDMTGNGRVDGGTGTWNSTNTNWTDQNGRQNTFWLGTNAVFGTVGGTVTVEGEISFNGLQFMLTPDNGYQIVAGQGGILRLSDVLNKGSCTITTDPGVTATISAPLADPIGTPPPDLMKDGTGTLTLSGANTYTGFTTVSAGILNIQNGSALGATTNGTFVESGATLQLQGGISVGDEELTISGTGATGQNGALVNVSGTNNYAGVIGLLGDTTISSDGGMLNLTGKTIFSDGEPVGLTLTGAGDGSISSIIDIDTGTLTKSGAGTWTLTGANTYSGDTIISAGILNIQNSTALGTTAAGTTVSSGATLQLQGGISVGDEALTISGVGAPGQNGALVNVSGINNYGGRLFLAGNTTISSDSGTLNLTNPGTITGLRLVTTELTLTGAGDGSISSILADGTGTLTLTKNGAGTWTLNGVNTYTGLTTVTAGTLAEAVSNAISTGDLTINGATAIFDLGTNHSDSVGIVTLDGGGSITGAGTSTLTSTGGFEMKSGTASAILDGSVALTKTTTGTVTLTGANTYTGGTTISAGTLRLGNGGTSGSIVGDVLDNGTFAVNRSDTFTFGGVISGTGAFQQIGSGTTVLTGTNTYTGGTAISTGTLQLGNGGTSGSIVGDVVNNGTFTINRSDTFTFGGVVSGTGAFQQLGTGTTVLTGTNTYTGGTTISAGTLQLGNGGTSGSIVGDVVDNGTFAINRSDTFTFGGVISGTGAFQQIGTGTTVLTGTSTYTGATMVNAGTLLVDGSLADASVVAVNSGATLGGTGTAAGAVTIADGGILAPGDSPGTAGTFTVGSLSLGNTSLLNYELGMPGVIGSRANDLINVTGNLTLDGSLNMTALTGFGPGSYRLFNYGGALTDNTLDIGTVPAGFSASNFVVITGLANEVDLLVLAGPLAPLVQFWDGPITVSNGVINGGTGNWDNFTTNWTDAAGNNNSSWQNGVAVFAGTAGTVTVREPIFFAGMEFMTSGYQIDQGLEGSLNLIGSPTITTDPNVTATINAILAGDGGITKEGTGTLILNAENTYLGNTTIDAGSLIVDGSIASAQTFVNPGGLLGGNGIIGGDLTNSGIVSPGDSPGMLGTLTVNGNYTQNANGTLRIEIAGTAPSQLDLLSVGGHASLAGTLQLVSLNNFKLSVGDNITFLTAQGGVSGTFSTIQNPFVTNTLIEAQINILANSVHLEGVQGSFTTVACNPNTMAVAKALNSAVGDPRAAELIAFLDAQPLQALCPELELISPEELAAMFNISVSLANIQSVNLERRMEDIQLGGPTGFSARGLLIDGRVPESSPGLAGPTGPEGKSGPSVMQPTPQNRWGVFVTGLGEFTSVDDTSIAPGYNFSTGGLTFGVDYRVCPNFAIGLTGGYAHTNANLVNNGNLDVNGGTIGAYATGFGGGFYVDGAVFGVFNGYDEHRTALLGTASGNTDGRDFNALVTAGYDWKSDGLTIGPVASYQYTYVEFDSFTERGSLAPLTFSDQNANSSRTALGAKALYDWHVGHVLIRPEIRASWQHEFGDRDYSLVSRFASGAGNNFTVHGPEIGRDSLLIGAGAAVLFNDRVSVYAYYDGELVRTNYSSNNVSAGLRFTF